MTQETALAILKTGANVFLTGEPGAGKTYTINKYVSYLRTHGIEPAITASTGIAATHIGGMTIHSWSGIGIKKDLMPEDISHILSSRGAAGRIRQAKVLIIDEVSMLDVRMLTMIDRVCRAARAPQDSFGGLQVIFVGDFFQLPPVVSAQDREMKSSFMDELYEEDQSRFAFQSRAWQSADPTVCYITEQHRQSDNEFLQLLTAIRSGNILAEHRVHLDSRLGITAPADDKNITKLFPHNEDVDRLNSIELGKIIAETKTFFMQAKGSRNLVDALKRGCLSPEQLDLKHGAAVMFTKNNFDEGFVNGTLGVVEGFDEETGQPHVRTRSGKLITVEPMIWAVSDGTQELASIKQLPLRLAWAMTVHKSQGMSLDAAFMDLRRVFVEGQGYVALSRVRTLKGLHLSGYNQKALMVNTIVAAADIEFKKQSQKAEKDLKAVAINNYEESCTNFILSCDGHLHVSKDESLETESEEPLLAYSVEQIRKDHAQAYAPWSEEEEDFLKAYNSSGKNVDEISELMGRKPGAISSRLKKLGLS